MEMSFNPDPTKPANEILFSHRKTNYAHRPLLFNNIEVKRVEEHKHLGQTFLIPSSILRHMSTKIPKKLEEVLVSFNISDPIFPLQL